MTITKNRTVGVELTTSNQDLYTVPANFETNIKSIFKWFAKLAFFALPTYFVLHYFVNIEALAQGMFFVILLIPLYHHRRKNTGEKWVKSKKAKKIHSLKYCQKK